jgi:hypothetical protein
LAGRGRNLRADPAGPDDDHRAAVVQPFAQRVGILHAAEIEDPVELCAGDLKPPRLGAGRQQEPVVPQPLAVVEFDFAARGVEADDYATQLQFDVVVGIEALFVDVDVFAPALAAHVVLGEGRAFVGALVLGADQHEAPFEALVAQGLGGLGAGQAGTDDDVGLVRRHGMSLRSGPGTLGVCGRRREPGRVGPR